ncbi:MAG TPA: Lsr2 family protein [Pseudonocardia sp.]|jgi:hypothetical protein|nr:Lsr2 family protein [Pseudonocardia sp.]
MATRTQVIYEDDVTGERIADEDVQPILWSLDGRGYRSVLTPERVAKFREMLTEFADCAEVVPMAQLASQRRRSSSSPARPTEQNRAIRDWARKQGLPVNDHGRLPAQLIDAFNAAH